MSITKIIVFVVLMIFLLGSLVLIVTGTIGVGAGGNRVTVHGTVYYDIISKWGVTYNSCDIQPESISFYFPGLYWFMETLDVLVHVEFMSYNGQVYSNYKWIGTMSSIVGSKGFTIVVHNVPSGSYQGMIYVYEIERNEISLFPFGPSFRWGELSRYLKATSSMGTLTIG